MMNAQWLIRWIIRLWGRKRDGNSAPLNNEQRAGIRSILLIRVDERIGNVLLTTPLAQALCEQFPHARIEWLVCRRYRWLVDDSAPPANRANLRILPFEKRALWTAPWYYFTLIFHLLRTPYDLVIDAAHEHRASFTSLILALLAGGRWLVGHRRSMEADNIYTHAVATNAPDDIHPGEEAHDALRKLRLLAPITNHVPDVSPWMSALPENVEDDVREWLQARRIESTRLLGVYVGGRKPDHRWPVERFGKFLESFGPPAGWRVVILWGPGEEELAVELEKKSEGRALRIPASDITYLQAFLRACDMVVVGNTGPLHMSWALGVPTVAVFRSSDALRWLPRSPNTVGVLPDDESGPWPENVESAARYVASQIEDGVFVPPKYDFEKEHASTDRNSEEI